MSLKKTVLLSVVALAGAVSVAEAVELETAEQRYSYTMGYQLAIQQLRAQGVMVDGAVVGEGINDGMQGLEPKLTLEQMQESIEIVRKAAELVKKQKAEAALAAGQKFLAENKKKAGVVTLDTGLQYIEEKAGEGESPKVEDTVTVHYRGTLLNGTEFDSSYSRGQPASFQLANVVPGFRQSLTLMKPGAKWKVFMPSELAYGARGAGGKIGPNETLIFEIELISVKKAG